MEPMGVNVKTEEHGSIPTNVRLHSTNARRSLGGFGALASCLGFRVYKV